MTHSANANPKVPVPARIVFTFSKYRPLNNSSSGKTL